MEELPGGRVLCSFQLQDRGKKSAVFLLNKLINTAEERHPSLEVSPWKKIIRDPGSSPGSFLDPPEIPFVSKPGALARSSAEFSWWVRCGLHTSSVGASALDPARSVVSLGRSEGSRRRGPASRLSSAARGRRNRAETGSKKQPHAAGVCPVQACWEHAGPCELGHDPGTEEEKPVLSSYVATPLCQRGKKTPQRGGERKTRGGSLPGWSVPGSACLTVTRHRGGKNQHGSALRLCSATGFSQGG